MSISDDLEKLAKKSDPKKTIYMIHEPPFNTPLDMIFNNNKYINEKSVHIGSKSIRNFIQNHVPLLTIHGHIHETFEVSGDFQIRNQASVAVTPSNDYRKNEVSCILFNFSELSKVERVIL